MRKGDLRSTLLASGVAASVVIGLLYVTFETSPNDQERDPYKDGRVASDSTNGVEQSQADIEDGTSLAAKMRHQVAIDDENSRRFEQAFGRAQQKQNALSDLARDVDPAYLSEIGETAVQLGNAFSAGRWEELMTMLDRLEEYGHSGRSLVRIYLSRLLRNGAPLDVIVAFVDRAGGVLPEDAILQLAFPSWKGAARVAAELERLYGLNPHYVDEYGRNALSVIADRYPLRATLLDPDHQPSNLLEMTDYLTNRSVAKQQPSVAFDVLDQVLIQILDTSALTHAGTSYLRLLIDRGYPVQRSHLELAKRIALTNSRGYRHLIKIIPELNSSA